MISDATKRVFPAQSQRIMLRGELAASEAGAAHQESEGRGR